MPAEQDIMKENPPAVYRALVLGGLILGSTAVAAQSDPTRLDGVFITAARTEQSLEKVSASVEVISAERIQTFSGRSLSEVLQYATGALVKDSGSSSSFALRGQDSDKTLILVDGLRRTEKYAGANLNNIQLEDVERIEIVRGPMSALYGSDALGGVINVITRGAKKGTEFGLRAMAGATGDSQRETGILAGYGNWGGAELAHRISFETKRREPYRLPETDGRLTDLNQERRDFVSYRGDLKSGLGRFDWGIELARQDDEGVGLGRTGSTYTKIEHEERAFGEAGYRGRVGAGELSLHLGYGESDARVNRGTTADELTLLKQTQVETQYAWAASDAHALVFGHAFRRDDADISTNSRRVARNANALFAQDNWQWTETLSASLGLRYDDYDDFGGKLTPRLALAWRPGNWTFRAGAGSGFKAPSLLNLYMTSIIRGRYDLRGNPNLEPEESVSGEVAAGYRFERGRIEAVVHQAEVTNLIASVPTGARGPGCGTTPTAATSCQIQEYRNIGKASIGGVEFIAEARLGEPWRLNGSIEYLEAQNKLDHTRLTDRPRWSAKVALEWRRGDWQVDARLRHVRDWYAADPALVGGPAFNSSYTTGALRLGYTFDRRLQVYGGIDNLADARMPANQTSRGSPDDPGARFFYAGLHYRF